MTQGETAPRARKNVLIVDDDPVVRSCLRKILMLRGHQVLEAASANLALMAVTKFPVDLVFLDVYLPDANGLSIMNQMFEIRADLKVALISSDPANFSLPQAQGERIVDCIGKPLSPERIERVLDGIFPPPPPPPAD